MNRHKSTIGREMRCNRGERGYRPKQAQAFSQARMRARENGPRVAAETWAIVELRLAQPWSPEQIAGHLRVEEQLPVSHEATYRRIYADKRTGGTCRALRCRKARRKRHGGRERRGTIPDQASIDLCPAIVAERARFGDWEGDLVIGAGQKHALVTLNERTSRYALIAHVPFKTAQAVSGARISLLTPFAGHVHTLTAGNGKEFSQHERIAGKLGADFFFAHPYASWERGANEKMNVLVRQFFPKKMSFQTMTQEDIEFAKHRLKHRPGKCLGFKTPHQPFMNRIHYCHNSAALQT